eukprot:TRINITY_DN1934_c0_g1_i1.p2 TRINITY_DN1934_c0_g1~~TRINITY_DN1934_c0_g1_i1.p2  ORF type:complete len:123 (-),score=47.22 TRINITY_DN1934_c0_g1_i1:616-984(-)
MNDDIIQPPPEIKFIVEQLAKKVIEYGIEFETSIRKIKADDPKFSFIDPNSPYYPYYKNQKEILEKESEPLKPDENQQMHEIEESEEENVQNEQQNIDVEPDIVEEDKVVEKNQSIRSTTYY